MKIINFFDQLKSINFKLFNFNYTDNRKVILNNTKSKISSKESLKLLKDKN